ncbi:ALK and LTK ligand 2a-like isoform X2 [Myxocyprinus asiaticus]|uniref:ALK and LTK ligand 2a-like isoform X2 n=1 Tax=Myxocyprinus asiaticus TaxID=70543 RepID=UPI00222368B3|nr:ALK and LTK ligand 2a-like isoform X2 [Myxocyprinus asiaticus]XP_051517710.1 ALK and LTK ligand 2a-like isoform X2 [Myxocyprinus asiaticus]
MRALRAPVVVMGLVLLICTTVHSDASANNVDKDEKTWFRRILDITRQVENSAGVERAQTTSKTERALQPKDNLKTKNGETILEIFPRDLRKKEKIIKHLTGPLYFSPKCRKHVYRLYHNTRDCTIPAYYKRCARLLTRLAGSPRCQEG